MLRYEDKKDAFHDLEDIDPKPGPLACRKR